MAQEGHKEEIGRSTLLGSEDGDPSRSMIMGSQDVHEYYCQPCDEGDNHVKATFYCKICTEYVCTKCSVSHKKFKQSMDHDIQDVQHMTHKPPISKKRHSVVTMATPVAGTQIIGYFFSLALMSTNQLLVADYFGQEVRLVNIVSDRHVSELRLSGWPCQVTRISDTEAAVTLPKDEKIVLLRTQPQLSVVREIRANKNCWDIAYMDNKLIVTFREGRVEILDMSGKVLRTISVDRRGKNIITGPYVAVNPVTGSIYMTDGRKKKCRLVKLSLEGSVEATYAFETAYSHPCKVALDSQGMIYLACTHSRMLGLKKSHYCVDQLNANCDKVRTILSNMAYFPLGLSYDEATQQLVVNRFEGVVKVYKLS